MDPSRHPSSGLLQDLLYAAGILLLVVPGLSLGISYVDHGHWPSLSDPRFGLMLFGLLLGVGLRLAGRHAADDDGFEDPGLRDGR